MHANVQDDFLNSLAIEGIVDRYALNVSCLVLPPGQQLGYIDHLYRRTNTFNETIQITVGERDDERVAFHWLLLQDVCAPGCVRA